MGGDVAPEHAIEVGADDVGAAFIDIVAELAFLGDVRAAADIGLGPAASAMSLPAGLTSPAGFAPGSVVATSKPGFSGSGSSNAMLTMVFAPKKSSSAPSTAMAIWFKR